MSLFKKRRGGPGSARPGPSSPPLRRPVPSTAPSKRSVDWRSYDAVAADYARTHGRISAVIANDLLTLSGASAGQRILDVGTGTGSALVPAHALAGETGIAVGIDASPGMLAAASAGLHLVAAEAINLPFHAETFDVALAAFSIPYFRKLDTALYDVRRVLRPGGVLAAAVWGAGEDELSKTWRTMLEQALGRDILQAGLRDEIPWGDKLANRAAFETTLRDAGFRPVTVERREYRFEISRDDYLLGLRIEAAGRYAKTMLGESLWASFLDRVTAEFVQRFPATLIDFRDVLLATGGVPANPGFAPTGYDRR